MNSELLLSFFSSIQAHPVIALFAVFVVAFTESLALLGIIVPGVVLMVAIGALVTLGHLPFWPTVLASFLGAVAGDGLSYYLGYYYKNSMSQWWPLSRYPHLLEKGHAFFQRHGVKSVVLGRFVGPLRPIIPAVAGMLNMPRRQFFVANIISAFFWAPLYLLPGMLFGLSLELATEFTGRFLIMALILLVSIWLVYHLVKKLYAALLPRTDIIILRIMGWSERHPLAGEIPASIIDPAHPEVRGISLLAIALIMSSVLFAAISPWVLPAAHTAGIDKLIFHAFQALHNPPTDHYLLIISFWGDRYNSMLFITMMAVWLLWRKNRAGFVHWLVVLSLPLLLSFFLPAQSFSDAVTSQQSAYVHGILYFSLWGFFTIMLSSEIPVKFRSYLYVAVAIVLLQLALSHLYMGIARSSELLTGFLIGFIWSGLLGIAYRRHFHPASPPQTSYRPVYAMLLVMLVIYPSVRYYMHTSETPVTTENRLQIAQSGWIESGWQLAPLIREDLFTTGHHPFNLQWAGKAEQISDKLARAGFSRATSVSSRIHQWLNPYAQTDQLALLPQVHNGHYETLRFVKYHAEDNAALVIRLWPTAYYLRSDNGSHIPLWAGSVSHVYQRSRLWFNYLVTDKNYNQAFNQFRKLLQDINQPSVSISFSTQDQHDYHLLLLWENSFSVGKNDAATE